MGFAFLIAIAAATFGIIGALVLLKILDWYLEGSIGGVECVLVAMLYIGLLISIVTLQIPVALIVLALLGILLIYRATLDRRDNRDYFTERIQECQNAIAIDPLNLAARGRLSETYYKQGRLDEAIAELSEAVRLSPHNREDTYRLNRLIAEREEKQSPPTVCPYCHHKNPSGRTIVWSVKETFDSAMSSSNGSHRADSGNWW